MFTRRNKEVVLCLVQIDIHTALRDAQFLLFADDLKIYLEISSHADCERLQITLNKLQVWCSTKQLQLNVSKCSTISFSRKLNPIIHSYFHLGQQLVRTENIRDLGVTFDSKLCFKDHIHDIYRRSLRTLGFITRNSYEFKSVQCFIHLYKSLVRPIVEYATEVWSPFYSAEKKLLQSVQNKFLRKLSFRLFIPNDSSSYVSLQSQFNLPDLDIRRDYFDVAFIYKLLNNQIDSSFLLSQLHINAPSRSLRSQDTFYTDCPRSNYMLASPLNRMMKVCNVVFIDVDVHNCSLSRIRRLMLGK